MSKVAETVLLSKAILLCNNQPGPTVFKAKDGTEVVWEGQNDPSGMDMQAVPLSYLEDVNFVRILNKGILEIVDAPDEVREVIESQLNNPILNRQAAAWRNKQAEQASHAAEPIEHVAKNDFVVGHCIGPATRGVGQCGAEVPVREFGGSSKPPLCNRHEDLAKFCTEIPTEVVVDGKEQTVWKLAQVDVRR